jgi:hypothetical protein
MHETIWQQNQVGIRKLRKQNLYVACSEIKYYDSPPILSFSNELP